MYISGFKKVSKKKVLTHLARTFFRNGFILKRRHDTKCIGCWHDVWYYLSMMTKCKKKNRWHFGIFYFPKYVIILFPVKSPQSTKELHAVLDSCPEQRVQDTSPYSRSSNLRLSCDDLTPDGCLDSDLKHLPRYGLFEALTHGLSHTVGPLSVDLELNQITCISTHAVPDESEICRVTIIGWMELWKTWTHQNEYDVR